MRCRQKARVERRHWGLDIASVGNLALPDEIPRAPDIRDLRAQIDDFPGRFWVSGGVRYFINAHLVAQFLGTALLGVIHYLVFSAYANG